MKTILITFVVCCLVQGLLGAHLKKSTTKGSCCITFYKDSDYNGSSFTSCDNKSSLGSFNDEVTSFKFGDNCKSITIYRNANYDGKSRTFEGDVSNLKDKCMTTSCWVPGVCWCEDDWNDRMSSFKIVAS